MPQSKLTKMVKGLKVKIYEEQLRKFGMLILEKRINI